MRLINWILGLLLLANASHAAVVIGTNQMVNVALAWDKSAETIVTGYKVYWGQATHTYTNNLDAKTNITATVSNLVANTTYYFAVTAYNAALQESPFSNEVTYTPFNVPPTNAPANLRVTFQMQASLNPVGPFSNIAGATVTITNQVDPLMPGQFYKTLIATVPIP